MRKSESLFKVLVIGLWLIMPQAASAALQSDGSYVADEVLIVPNQGMQAAAVQGAMNAGMHVMMAHTGRTPFLRLKLKAGQSVQSVMTALSAQPWVAKVQPNYIYHAMAIPNDPLFGNYWGLQNTGQMVNGVTGTPGADMSVVSAWNETTYCYSVVVADIDSGVDYNHPDLAGNIWTNTAETPNNGIDDDGNGFIDDVQGWDFVQNDKDPMDFYYHGTHVAGTIGAAGNNGIGGAGICWTVRIMPVRVLNSVGAGTTANITAGVDYAVANGAKVINMSLGGSNGTPGDILDTAIANANTAGVLVVTSAGNSASNNDLIPTYPASYNQPNIIAVAATDQNDMLASFSNYGLTSVDVGAPGVNILSTTPPARTFVMTENFDTGAVGWTFQTWDNTTATQVANTTAVTTETKVSGTSSLTDSPGALYANNRSYRAISPVINLTGQQGAVISYAMMLDSELNIDHLYIESSPDTVTWTPQQSWSGSTLGVWYTGFQADAQSMDGLATNQLRFRLETNATNVFDGFHVDDVSVTVPNTAVAAHNAATNYTYLNGTSMAAPQVAGIAALILAADPGLSVTQLRNRILNNGDPVAALAGKTVTGRRVNAQMSMPLHAATALGATAASYTRVNLTWADNSVSEQNYLVQRSTGGAYSTIATLAANTVSYTDMLAPAGSNLNYQIVALGRDARSVTSASVSVSTPAAPPSSGGGCTINPLERFDPVLLLLVAIAAMHLVRRREYCRPSL